MYPAPTRSKLEGWGLPAGEALWCGTPTICSTAEALREVCGDLAVYFEPEDASHLARIIHRLMTDQEFTNDLRKKISNARPTLRTWQMVAKETLEALEGSHREIKSMLG